jgi:general secretion pathway protein E
LSHLNIAEKRLPQDGRIKIRLANNEVDIRVSIIPMLHGEAVVMRLLRQKATLAGHGTIGHGAASAEIFQARAGAAARHYTCHRPDRQRQDLDALHRAGAINDDIRKIITIEDPIEYQCGASIRFRFRKRRG